MIQTLDLPCDIMKLPFGSVDDVYHFMVRIYQNFNNFVLIYIEI